MKYNVILLIMLFVAVTDWSFAQTLYVPGGATSGIGNNTVNGNVGISEPNPVFKLHMPSNTQLAIHTTYVDNCIDVDNSYTRSSFGSNVYWDAVNNLWKVRAIGANDFSAIVHPNQDGWAFIAAPADGNVPKSLTNSEFLHYQRLRIRANGNIGIGTGGPLSRLHIHEGPGGEQLRLSRGTGTVRFAQELNKDNLYLFNGDASQTYMAWKENGYVGIGTTSPDAKLTVKGTVHAQEVKVDLQGAVTPDYVFDDNYNLPTLSDIASYIRENKHLPEIPSAAEMEKDGIHLKEMNLLLLKKIEELTLYVIDLNDRLTEKERLAEQQVEIIGQLKSEIAGMKK